MTLWFGPAARASCSLLLAATALLSGASLVGGDQAAAATEAGAPAPAVTVLTLRPSEFTPGFGFNGRVVAVDKVYLRARVAGFIKQRLFREGGDVSTGDLLFVLEKDQYQAMVDQQQAALASAGANKADTAAQLARGAELVKNGNIPQSEVDLRRASDLMAAASIQEAQAGLDQARINLGYTEIRAPLAGRISRSTFSVGSLVGSESGVLATIVSQDPIYVTFQVTQRELLAHRQRIGDPVVKVTLPDGSLYQHTGKLNFLDVRIDPGTDTLMVRAQLPNPDRTLIDGQFVGVRVERGEPRRVVEVPQAAVQVNQAGPYVLVVGEDDKVEARSVRLGAMAGVRVVVEEGLNEGDRVIVEGVQKVRPGMTVEASEQPPAPPSGATEPEVAGSGSRT